MSFLKRVNPRGARGSLIQQINRRTPTGAAGLIYEEEYFGTIVTVETAQGSQTTDASISAASATGAVVDTGQGSQTTDAAGLIAWESQVTTGQGSQTSDSVVNPPITVETANAQTSAGALYVYNTIYPEGFLDNATTVATPHPNLWRLNPRNARGSLAQQLARFGGAESDLAQDAYFGTIYTYEYVDGFGDASIANVGLRALASGFDTLAFGTASISNHQQFVRPAGILSLESGTALIYNGTIFATAAGFDDELFGFPTVRGPRRVFQTGITQTQWGVPNIHARLRSVPVSGFDSLAFGHHVISDLTQYVFPTGDDFAAIDPHLIGLWPFQWVVEDSAASDFAEFGEPVVNGARWLRPAPFDSLHIGTGTHILPIKPRDFDSLEFGVAWISNWIRYVTPRGWDDFLYGSAEISNWIRYIYPRGLDAAVVWYDYGPVDPITGLGPHVGRGPTRIFPVGFTNTEWDDCYHEHPWIGNPKVLGGAPSIRAIGFDSLDMSAEYQRADYVAEDYFANDNAIFVGHA